MNQLTDVISCMVFLMYNLSFFKVLDKSALLLETWIHEELSTMVRS